MNAVAHAIERFGEWCLYTLHTWLMVAALILLLVLISVQAGIHKGRMLERAELEARGTVSGLSNTEYLRAGRSQ